MCVCVFVLFGPDVLEQIKVERRGKAVRMCACACKCVNERVCVCVYIYVCMCVCVYIYIYIYSKYVCL